MTISENRRLRSFAAALVFALSSAALVAVPALAQEGGPQTIEPTLAECQAFVDENGVPSQRPFAEGRGYSGWDVCLSMAYDGDLAGAFDASDTDGDGALSAGEQAVYVEGVMGGNPSGPGDAGPVEPLTLEECRVLVQENGVPGSDPLATISGGTRPEFELALCQSLAMSGDLDAAFASADTNGDGALDLPEQTDYQRSVASPIGEGEVTQPLTVERCEALVQENGLPESDPLHFYYGGTQESYDVAVCQSLAMGGDLIGAFASADTSGDGTLQQAEVTAYARNQAAGTEITGGDAGIEITGGAAGDQYEQTGMEATGFEETTGAVPETTAATAQPEATTGGAEQPDEGGVLSAIGSLLRGDLPSTGGATLLGLAAAAVLIVGGGILAYRSRR